MTSSNSLGDRILFAIERRENKESSKSALARAIGVTPQTLAAMCRPTYSRPEDWVKIKLLAMETGWSFLWLRDGVGRLPAKMEQDEAESLRLELSGGIGVVAAGAAQPADNGQPRLPQIDPFLFAQVIGAIEAHPRRINQGWTNAVTIPCAIAIYNATVLGQITPANWAESIQTFRCY